LNSVYSHDLNGASLQNYSFQITNHDSQSLQLQSYLQNQELKEFAQIEHGYNRRQEEKNKNQGIEWLGMDQAAVLLDLRIELEKDIV
jgi:hypothetical protein